jgi:hypothetical protein
MYVCIYIYMYIYTHTHELRHLQVTGGHIGAIVPFYALRTQIILGQLRLCFATY